MYDDCIYEYEPRILSHFKLEILSCSAIVARQTLDTEYTERALCVALPRFPTWGQDINSLTAAAVAVPVHDGRLRHFGRRGRSGPHESAHARDENEEPVEGRGQHISVYGRDRQSAFFCAFSTHKMSFNAFFAPICHDRPGLS